MTDDSKDILHYGVKGMRWGVVNEPASSDTFSVKQYQDAVKNSPSQQVPTDPVAHAKLMAEKKEKFHNKFQPSPPVETVDNTSKGWRPTGTQVAVVATGAAFAGLYIYGRHLQKTDSLPFDWPSPGSKLDPNKYMKVVNESWMNTPACSLTRESWARKEYSIPAGTLFHRISGVAEDKWDSGGTYMTHSVADYHRYIFGFAEIEKGGAVGGFHITSKATQEVRVPNLKTTLDALHKAMKDDWKDYGLDKKPKAEDVFEQYRMLSGGGWPNSGISARFFKELKSRGYSAIVDEMDAGIIGETPIVLFDSGKMTAKSASKITKQDVLYAGENLTEILYRKKGSS